MIMPFTLMNPSGAVASDGKTFSRGPAHREARHANNDKREHLLGDVLI
jgi:hypothetical protein